MLSSVCLESCKQEDIETVNEYTYYPLSEGQYSIFEVRRVTYSSGQDSVVNNWQEKNEVISMSTNSDGSNSYLVSLLARTNSFDYWQKVKEINIRKYPDKVIENVDNEVIVSMIFPIDEKVKWDGFMYFNLNDKNYRYGYKYFYENPGEPLRVDRTIFEKTVLVNERIDTSRTHYKVAGKYYAENIGLVLSEHADFQYLQKDGELVGNKIIDSGVRKTKKIIEFGNN